MIFWVSTASESSPDLQISQAVYECVSRVARPRDSCNGAMPSQVRRKPSETESLSPTYPRIALIRISSSTKNSTIREGDMNIESKVVLITGANRGIGRAPLEDALRRGAKRNLTRGE